MARRILIIEDDEIAARVMKLVLSAQGHEATSSSTGEEGVAWAKLNQPDVVISDLGLPGELDGCAVARELRSWAVSKRLLLIATSGYVEDDDRQAACDAGFDCFLTKPVALEKIHELFPLLDDRCENIFPDGDVRLLPRTV